MAKRNLFLGTASGKIGDIVVYRAGGTQRSRVRVIPKDAKTEKQCAQRSRIGNVVALYRAGKGLFESTFENRASKQTAYNAFAQFALPNAPYLLKQDVEAGNAAPQYCSFSRGTIPSPFIRVLANASNMQAVLPIVENAEMTKVGELSQALIDARPCCFKNGSVIILAMIKFEGTSQPGKPTLIVQRFQLNTSSTQLLSAFLGMTITVSGAEATFTAQAGAETPIMAAAMVMNEDSDGLHVSSADAVLNSTAESLNDGLWDPDSIKAAADSYGGSGGNCVLNGTNINIPTPVP